MKTSILITGGLGFVGSSLSKYLSNQGQYNIIISTRKQEKLPDELLNCNVVQIDQHISNEKLIEELKNVQIVIHLAALNENDCLLNPEDAIIVNVLGLNKMLNASIIAGVKKFIYFSTAHVYCSPLRGLITEKNCPLPLHPYAITHKAAEDYVIAATLQEKIEGIVLRLSNSIGAPLHSRVNRWTLLVNDICKQIAETGEIHLKTSGTQLRNFIAMNDVCRATEHVFNLDTFDKSFPVYNLGGPSNLSINEMTEIVIETCRRTFGFSPSVSKPNKLENSHELLYDSTKLAKTGFAWRNNLDIEIEESLRAAFKFFRN